MVHRDFHPGNILFMDKTTCTSFYEYNTKCNICISDMGLSSLCEEVGDTDESKLCGIMPYMAPEVLRFNPYTQAADIYSFGMIMYLIATGKQPFSNHAHDQFLALDICEDGIRPEIKEPEAPRCYIDLMKKCLDANPDNRPNATEIQKSLKLFKEQQQYEIEGQFKEADKYRETKAFIKNNQHSQAIYTSRVLNLNFSKTPNHI
jgi:serine/threonine protein kinase